MTLSPRLTFFGLAIILFVCGTSFLIWSNAIPQFTDEDAATELFWSQGPALHPQPEYQQSAQEWHDSMNAFRTAKWQIFGVGWTAITLGTISSLATLLLFLRPVRDWRGLSTPRNRITFCMMGLISWLMIPVGFVVDSIAAFDRLEAPPWADSLAIPFGQAATSLPVIITLAMAFSLPAALLVRMPASLTANSKDRSWVSIVATLVLILIALAWTGIAAMSFWDGEIIYTVVMLMWVYLTLSTRAGIVNRWARPRNVS